MPRETEAKFLVRDPKVLRAVGRLSRIGPFRFWRSQTEPQTNIYLDTPDLRLRRAHAALKIRRIGRRAELTFKQQTSYRGGVSQRTEVTAPLRRGAWWRFRQRQPLRPGQIPAAEVGRLQAAPLKRARRIIGDRPLRPVLVLKTRRHRRLFVCPKGRLELDLDRVMVMVRKQTGTRSYRELEVENRGAPEALFRKVLAELRRRFGQGLRPSRRSKYQIGLQLART